MWNLLYILKLKFSAGARSERNHQNKKIQMCLLLIADYADYQWQYPGIDSAGASVYTVSGSAFEPWKLIELIAEKTSEMQIIF